MPESLLAFSRCPTDRLAMVSHCSHHSLYRLVAKRAQFEVHEELPEHHWLGGEGSSLSMDMIWSESTPEEEDFFPRVPFPGKC